METRKLAELKPPVCPSRKHSATTTELARRSLDAHGLLSLPTLNIRSGRLLSLRSVVEAAAMLGLEELPVWCVELDEAEEEAAALMLNSHLNEWDWEHVAAKLKRVQAAGLPLTLTGLPESDTGPLLAADWKPADKAPLDDVHADTKQDGFGF